MTAKELNYAIAGICHGRRCVDCPLSRRPGQNWCRVLEFNKKCHEYEEGIRRVEEAFELFYDKIPEAYKMFVPKPTTLRLEEDDVMAILQPPEE